MPAKAMPVNMLEHLSRELTVRCLSRSSTYAVERRCPELRICMSWGFGVPLRTIDLIDEKRWSDGLDFVRKHRRITTMFGPRDDAQALERPRLQIMGLSIASGAMWTPRSSMKNMGLNRPQGRCVEGSSPSASKTLSGGLSNRRASRTTPMSVIGSATAPPRPPVRCGRRTRCA